VISIIPRPKGISQAHTLYWAAVDVARNNDLKADTLRGNTRVAWGECWAADRWILAASGTRRCADALLQDSKHYLTIYHR
jgi:hypothetical protein